MRVAVCDLDVRMALVELDEIVRMFEPRAGDWLRCEVMLSPPAASALDARIRRSTSDRQLVTFCSRGVPRSEQKLDSAMRTKNGELRAPSALLIRSG